MVDGNKLGIVGFDKLGTPYSSMDCQTFIEWCLGQCGLKKDLAGSNAWYREVMKNGVIMTPEECVKQLGKVPAGAFLFIHAFDGGEEKRGYHDGLGNASHIGIVTGRGEGAIHSSASRGCVAESSFKGKTIKNGGWNKVGLWNQVTYDYGGGSSPAPDPEPEPDPQKATVWADNGKPVNFRKRPSRLSALVDKVPCNDQVELVTYGDDWSLIRWQKKTGYMMSKYLFIDDIDMKYYTVTVEHVRRDVAEDIVETYGGRMDVEG